MNQAKKAGTKPTIRNFRVGKGTVRPLLRWHGEALPAVKVDTASTVVIVNNNTVYAQPIGSKGLVELPKVGKWIYCLPDPKPIKNKCRYARLAELFQETFILQQREQIKEERIKLASYVKAAGANPVMREVPKMSVEQSHALSRRMLARTAEERARELYDDAE